ncbi:MAG: SdrD B-like domain-containing protein, partial [Chloroflexales bacterium]
RNQGYYQDATITSLVFDERVGVANNDYVAGDLGLNGVSVGLNTITGTLAITGTTDTTGMVTFTTRPGRAYWLNLDPAGIGTALIASTGFTNPLTVTGNTLLSGGASYADANPGDNSFGYYKPATITGTVFFDGNLDNQKANESGIAGVEVGLNDGTTTVITTTDATGAYTFTGVVSNSYTLVFTNPDPLNFSFIVSGTAPLPNDSAVDASGLINLGLIGYGTNKANQDAGLVGLSTVSGRTFEDGNANGLSSDASVDRGLPGVAVTLTLDVNLSGLTTQITRTTVTSPTAAITGTYSFTGLPGEGGILVGTAAYSLTFTPPAPVWKLTTANVGGTSNRDNNSDGYLTIQPLTATMTITHNQGYYQDATVTARVFEERLGTADNAYQVGDVGLTGVTVTLELLGSTAVQTKTTDATGVVTLTGRPGNAYQLRLDPTNVPAGLISSGFTNPVTVTTTPVGGQLSSGGTSLTDNAGANSFGHYRTATITGTVFFDGNLDNLKANESGVAGVGVTLLRGESVVSTTTTAATGAYTFTDVLSNSYTLVFTNPDTGNFAFVTGGDSAVATPGAMATSTISLGDVTYGTNQPNQDAGLVGRSSVVGRTFVDDNANGSSEDDTDPGLPGATVVLTLDVNLPGLTTQITRSTVTTETAALNNTFSFGGLPSSSAYTLTFTAPTATPVWQLTTADAVGVPNASNSDGNLRSLTLLANTAAELDQGYYQDATIVARIFDEQVTVNGVFEPGEVGLSGSTVNINPAASSGGGASDSTGLITYTVKPGVYTVARPAPDPVGFMVSPANPATAQVTVTSGLSAAPLDFGYFKPSTLAGTAWFDTNGNGLLDPDEPGMEAITVTLETGVGDTLGAPVQTDATGAYTITGVTPNTATGAPVDYKLCFSTTTAFTYTLKTGQIADDNNSDVNTAGCTDPFTVRGSNTVSTTTDAGYRGLNSIGDLVWNDLSGDGLQNSTEDGLAGAVVTVAISTTDGLINASNPTLTMTATSSTSTALGANYAVTGVPPAVGFRVVSVTPPLGFIPAPTNQGANDAIDSDPVDYTGGAVPPDVTNLDFGFAAVTTVGDLVWLDL